MNGHPGHHVACANTSRQCAESIDLALLRLGATGSRTTSLVAWAESKDFRGCPLQHTVSELTDAAHPARAIAHDQRPWFAERLREWTTTAGVKDSKATARALMVLFDGAVAGSEVDGPQQASDARWLAKKLLAG